MVLAAAFLPLAQYKTLWPAVTADNGYAVYVEAAKLLHESPDWQKLLKARYQGYSSGLFRAEAKLAGPLFALIKKGNSMPCYYPEKHRTECSLYPELPEFRNIERIAGDIATEKATEGDLESSSKWLVLADRFTEHFSSPSVISVLVKHRMIGELRATTHKLLPKFQTGQLREQIVALGRIASNLPDIKGAAIGDFEAMKLEIHLDVSDPKRIGMPDKGFDEAAAFENMLAAFPSMSPSVAKEIAAVMKSHPETHSETKGDLSATLANLRRAEPTLPPKDRKEFDEFVGLLAPKPYKLSEYAKTLDPQSKAHAEKLLNVYLDPPYLSWIAAFQRPERQWALPWKPAPETDFTKLMVMEGKTASNLKIDLYALQLADALEKLGDIDPTPSIFRRVLVDREKSRLAVIEAQIELYQRLHQKLPDSLKPMANPVDPTTGRQFAYQKTSPSTYTLAAVDVPGFKRIDSDTAGLFKAK